jgi:hypothetical protein
MQDLFISLASLGLFSLLKALKGQFSCLRSYSNEGIWNTLTNLYNEINLK